MASGKLLVLIGDECKHQESYHGLDKEYFFSVLIGTSSDSGDVLGIIHEKGPSLVSEKDIDAVLSALTGTITLPYPIFSSRTVAGKPLHTWAVEGRLHEIEVPLKTSTVYLIERRSIRYLTRANMTTEALAKIDLLPKVTDPRKALGNDFRRPEVKASWYKFRENGSLDDQFAIIDLVCIASSGTYMRSLAEVIGERLGSKGLAYSIHRTEIGRYDPQERVWSHRF